MNLQRLSISHLTTIAFLSAVGIALHVLESIVPIPVPFLKIGLANTASLIALMVFGPWEMILVVFTRVVVGSLLSGTIFGPSFVIGLAGGLAAAAGMAAARTLFGSLFSVVGISLIGSVSHIVTQLLTVMLFFVRQDELLYLLPLLLFSALIGGLIVGLISQRVIPLIDPFPRSG